MALGTHGTLWYTSGIAKVPVYFPEDRICCSNCKFIKERYGLRYECLLTDEIIINVKDIGYCCPIDRNTFKDVKKQIDDDRFNVEINSNLGDESNVPF